MDVDEEVSFDMPINSYSVPELEELICRASDAYYNDVPIISDAVFDRLQDRLRELAPESTVLTQVGAPVPPDANRVTSGLWLGSLDKVNTNKGLIKFAGGCKHFTVSGKLDGMSALYNCATGEMCLRGGGAQGADISCLVASLRLPTYKRNCYVRGELVVPRKNFAKLGITEGSRHQMGGRVRALDVEYAKNIDFVAFELIENGETQRPPAEQFRILHSYGFEVPWHTGVDHLSMAELTDYVKRMREEGEHEMDGVVVARAQPYRRVSSGNGKHAIKFKIDLDDQMRPTTVTKVSWELSRYGVLTPVVHVKPVLIGSAMCSKFTGSSAKLVHNTGLNVGASVIMKKSGDVIPEIHRVVTRAQDKAYPSIPFVWDGASMRIPVPDENLQVQAKRLHAFFCDLGVKKIGESMATKLVHAGIVAVQKLCEKSAEELETIDGIGPISAEYLVEQCALLREEHYTLSQILQASSCFESFGGKRLRQIVASFPSLEDVTAEGIELLPGFSSILADRFMKGLVKFAAWRQTNSCVKWKTFTGERSVTSKGSVVMSGFRDKELSAKLEAQGFEVANSIRRDTVLLIVKEMKETSKVRKAKEKGIEIKLRSDV